jgi:DNA-binding NarL/FixJ family response regulator
MEKKLKFLIIEDSRTTFTVVRDHLEQNFPNCDVMPAAKNEFEAENLLQENSDADILILDLGINRGNSQQDIDTKTGQKFIHLVKKEYPNIQILVYSYTNTQPVLSFCKQNSVPHVWKNDDNFSVYLLLKKIKELLSRKGSN